MSKLYNGTGMQTSCHDSRVMQYYSFEVSKPLKTIQNILSLGAVQNKQRPWYIVIPNHILYAYWSWIHNFLFIFLLRYDLPQVCQP